MKQLYLTITVITICKICPYTVYNIFVLIFYLNLPDFVIHLKKYFWQPNVYINCDVIVLTRVIFCWYQSNILQSQNCENELIYIFTAMFPVKSTSVIHSSALLQLWTHSFASLLSLISSRLGTIDSFYFVQQNPKTTCVIIIFHAIIVLCIVVRTFEREEKRKWISFDYSIRVEMHLKN